MLCLPYAKKKLTFLFWVLLLPVLNGDLASHKIIPTSTVASVKLCPGSSLINFWQHVYVVEVWRKTVWKAWGMKMRWTGFESFALRYNVLFYTFCELELLFVNIWQAYFPSKGGVECNVCCGQRLRKARWYGSMVLQSDGRQIPHCADAQGQKLSDVWSISWAG